MSDEDIGAGARWLTDISNELNDATVGILCVTPENQSNPWLVFEGGALSKTLDQPFVCPLLFDMSAGQLTGPLSQFQALSFDRNGIRRLLANLNTALGNPALPESDLAEIFDVWWPKLEASLQNVPAYDSGAVTRRTSDELLEEILENSREQLRRENIRLEHVRTRDEKLDAIIPYFERIGAIAQQSVEGGQTVRDLLGQKLALPADMMASLQGGAVSEKTSILMNEMIHQLKSMSDVSKREVQELLAPPNSASPSSTAPDPN
jgi:hypothetical protein